VASVAWSPSRILVYKSVAYLLTFTMFCVVAGACIVAGRRERAVRLFAFALAVAGLMALYGLYIFAVYGDFRRWSGWEDIDGRAYLAFGHTVANGAGIAFCLAISARLGSAKQAAGALLFAAAAVFLLVGGGRGPFLGVALAALVGLAARPPRAARGRIELPRNTAAAFLFLALAAAYIAYLVASGEMTTTLARFAKLASQAEDPTMVQGPNRFDYWTAAWRFWLQAPFLGHGLNSFSVLLRGGRELEGSHPHNIVLQILAELGLVGLFLFGLFVWLAARHASSRRLRRDPLMVCALLFVVTSAMSALFGRDIVDARKFFFALSLLALRPPAAAGEKAREAAANWRRDAGTARRPMGAAR
jgi:O-antigen ligase